jgi:hypothetical protein
MLSLVVPVCLKQQPVTPADVSRRVAGRLLGLHIVKAIEATRMGWAEHESGETSGLAERASKRGASCILDGNKAFSNSAARLIYAFRFLDSENLVCLPRENDVTVFEYARSN